jgi:DNA polymerase III delta subunit
VLGGEGAGLSEMLAEELVLAFRRAGDTAELVRWSVADLERESPGAAWRSSTFFARRRVFLLPDAGEWKQAPRKEIAAYLASPDPAVALVIPCADRRSRALFASVPGVRSSFPGEEDVLAAMADFAVSRAAAEGKTLPEEAAGFLARWVGSDFPRFRTEIGKLLSFAGVGEEIGEKEIRRVCVAGGRVDPFRLADDLVARDGKACLDKFRRFAAGADSADYHSLVGAIAWSVRRRLSSSKGGAPVAGRAGEILSALARIDGRLKGGSALSPEQVFEIELLKLLAR